MKNLHKSAQIWVLSSAVFFSYYFFLIFLTSASYKFRDWKQFWAKMEIIILIISKQTVVSLRISFFPAFIINMTFSHK